MMETGNLYRLLGGTSVQSSGPMLSEFWANFKSVHPGFELFQSEYSHINRSDCIPIYAHADGGRGYKKSEFMVFNWSAVMGNGTGKANRKDPDVRRFRKKRDAMQVNLLGHSFSTHYLWATISYTLHKNEDCFQEMLLQFGADLRECFDKGIDFHGRTIRLVCIGLKADMKLQARAGQMTRWYSTARKAPYDANKRNQSSGRWCWLCLGGDIAYPYEEIHSENPAWWRSMQVDTEPPWNDECGLVSFSLKYEKPATFFLPDLFHIYLAGFGQDYAASALVYLLPIAFQSPHAASVEAHFEVLNTCWKAWKKCSRWLPTPGPSTGTTWRILTIQKHILQVLGQKHLTRQKSLLSLSTSPVSGWMTIPMTKYSTTYIWQAKQLVLACGASTSVIFG